MRLINVNTLQLEMFDGGPRVTFAILSHTWGDEEVTFSDMMSYSAFSSWSPLPRSSSGIQQAKAVEAKKGFSKIFRCCTKARNEGYQYVWIDTCCIDKSSSSELSEAINSMFRWYHEAEVCYALLSDVSIATGSKSGSSAPSFVPKSGPGSDPASTSASRVSTASTSRSGNSGEDGKAEEDLDVLKEQLDKSRWFTRGWTLQELLAPLEVVFVDKEWKELGTRETLSGTIEEITGISVSVLKMEKSLAEFSIAQRMSWAAGRNTSRVEDEAYCLMGIFDVSMPLLYGEGRKAFKRLQLEIMRQSTDRSILAWASPDSHGVIEGVLASSPAMFEDCGGVRWCPELRFPPGNQSMDNHMLNYNACHDIIGFSLRMEAGVLEPPPSSSSSFVPGPGLGRGAIAATMGPMVFREYWDFADEDGNMLASPLTKGEAEIQVEADVEEKDGEQEPLISDLVHFPKDVWEAHYTHERAFREFDYGFLRHGKNRKVVLIMLSGCIKGGCGLDTDNNNNNSSNIEPEYTVGITLCSDTDGLMKRVHFPSRFLIPQHATSLFTTRVQTLHASLLGTEVLQQPLLPNFAKCMVRVLPTELSEKTPYELAYTIPAMADSSADSGGIWYLERWGTVLDQASLRMQPCFSLHRPGTSRAMFFHHKMDSSLSFVIIFTLVKAPVPKPTTTATATAPQPPLPPVLSRESSISSSIASLTSVFSRSFTGSTSVSSISNSRSTEPGPGPSSTSNLTSTTKKSSAIPTTSSNNGQNKSKNIGLKTQTQIPYKQWFQVVYLHGPKALELGFEADLASVLPTQPSTSPTYSYQFDLPDTTLTLSVKIRKAPKAYNARLKNYNALLEFRYKPV